MSTNPEEITFKLNKLELYKLNILKELLVVRHAKSSWDNPGLKDIDRPLNERGKRNGPDMAKFIAGKELVPQLLISSPAKRARKTAKYFSKEFFGKKKIDINYDLYFGGTGDFLHVLSETDNSLSRVAIFSHNPMINEFVNQYTEQYIPNVPTCGIAHIIFDIENWDEISSHNGRIAGLYFPKEVL